MYVSVRVCVSVCIADVTIVSYYILIFWDELKPNQGVIVGSVDFMWPSGWGLSNPFYKCIRAGNTLHSLDQRAIFLSESMAQSIKVQASFI